MKELRAGLRRTGETLSNFTPFLRPRRGGLLLALGVLLLETVTSLAQPWPLALIIDYGHEKSAPCDTLQAVKGHRYVPVLVDAGEQDLTAHVDFEVLGQAARDAGATVTDVATQGDWLNSLGIGARAAGLATANPERVPDIEKAVDRLCHEEQMGQLFKVMAIHSPDWPAPAGFAQ